MSSRYLIIQMMHHGDVLLHTAVVDALKKALPHCTVDMLVYREMQDILSENPQIGKVWTVDRAWKQLGTFGRLREELRLAAALRNAHYDVVLNYSDRWRAAWLAYHSGAKTRAAFDFAKRRNVLWRHLHTVLMPHRLHEMHSVENALSLLDGLVLPPYGKPSVLMGISEATRQRAAGKLAAAGRLKTGGAAKQGYILIHPGARWAFKCWESGKYAELIARLLDAGENVVLTAAPDKREQNVLDEICALLPEPLPQTGSLLRVDGAFNLRELAAAIDGAKLFVGVDSVPMHIAAALGKPQVALFGATWVSRWRPYSEAAEVVWAGDYGRLPNPDCVDTAREGSLLGAISVETVWQAVQRKLAETDDKAV
ncbi:MAG: putative lipopolysaccharide heptosyltransferase III [Neisseria sp.]|nr:putative lipopolysaccharide heptosyltransferase III [Neisseria sp.]